MGGGWGGDGGGGGGGDGGGGDGLWDEHFNDDKTLSLLQYFKYIYLTFCCISLLPIFCTWRVVCGVTVLK